MCALLYLTLLTYFTYPTTSLSLFLSLSPFLSFLLQVYALSPVTVALTELHEWLIANFEPFRRSCCIDITSGPLSTLQLTKAELREMHLGDEEDSVFPDASSVDEEESTAESAESKNVSSQEIIVQWDTEAVHGNSRMAFIYCISPPRNEEDVEGDDGEATDDVGSMRGNSYEVFASGPLVGRLRLSVQGREAHAELRAAVAQLREVRSSPLMLLLGPFLLSPHTSSSPSPSPSLSFLSLPAGLWRGLWRGGNLRCRFREARTRR